VSPIAITETRRDVALFSPPPACGRGLGLVNPHEFLNNEDHLTSVASVSRAARVRFLRAAAAREGFFPARSLRPELKTKLRAGKKLRAPANAKPKVDLDPHVT